MQSTVMVAALLFLSAAASGLAQAAGDATRGEQLYESRCIACHSLDESRVGPKHRGVYGRKAGSVPDFAYSRALVDSKIVWSDTTLHRWLTNPEALIPGQRMNIQVQSAEDRADLIAFLRRESGP
jgi:cytochrome c